MNDNNGYVVNHHHHHHHDNDNNHSPTSSFSQKLQDSICNMSCCFRTSKHHHHHHQAISPVHVRSTRLLRSSSTWIKSRAHDPLPEIKGKCRTLISRISRHRRRHSADFHYDALSYSRNFDEGDEESNDDEFPFRSFSSRLPPSPPLDEEEDEEEEPRSAPASSSVSASKTTSEIISACS